MKEQIIKLRAEGKSYREIKKILGCSKGTIAYHCGYGQKEKNKKRNENNYGPNLISKKIDRFQKKALQDRSDGFQRERVKGYKSKTGSWQTIGKHLEKTFRYADVLEKFGRYTNCYLTGRPIDLFEPKAYNFDHKIPPCKGGSYLIENLGITCKEANFAKSDMLVPDFLNLCKEILEYNGYEVKKKK